MKVHFIGFGNMAQAMARGFAGESSLYLSASAPSLPEGLFENRIHTSPDNFKYLKAADIVLLAVKPQQTARVMQEIGSHLGDGSVLVSIVSGINLSKLHSFCPENQAVVRAMPNTPVSIGKGISGLYGNHLVTDTHKIALDGLFQKLGMSVWFDAEEKINAITALAGSGPAYVFYFIESMIKAGKTLGFENAQAKQLVLQTVSGAVSLLEKSRLAPEVLRKKVTSPAGTTAAALGILEDNDFEGILTRAIKAARERALELDKLL